MNGTTDSEAGSETCLTYRDENSKRLMHAGGLGTEPIHTLRSRGRRKASLELCHRLLSGIRLEKHDPVGGNGFELRSICL